VCVCVCMCWVGVMCVCVNFVVGNGLFACIKFVYIYIHRFTRTQINNKRTYSYIPIS
jgi:hypothetical protein